MTLITSNLVGGETLAIDKLRITEIAEYWLGEGSLDSAITRGDVRNLLNSVCIPPINNGELCGSFYAKLNALNDPDTYVAEKLFDAGATDGFLFDFSDTSKLFQDATGTTAITAPGQTIGLSVDKSRVRSPVTSCAGVQASAGLRPTYGIAPKSRRNLLRWTEELNDAVWTKIVVAAGSAPLITANATTAPDGSLTADMVTIPAQSSGNSGILRQTVTGLTNPTMLKSSIYLRADAPTVVYLRNGDGGTASELNITTSWQRFEALSGSNPATSFLFDILPKSLLVNVSVEKVFYAWGGQLEIGSTVTPYQSVKTAFETAETGFPSFGYSRFDGIDDKLTITLPAAIGGDLMLFGRNGSWIETNVALPSDALDIGPTGMSVVSGILRVIGDLVGVAVVNRATTATEREMILRYFAARGAAGWLVAGAEMLVNGTFDTDLTDWTNESPARGVSTWEAGAAKLDNTGTGNTILWQIKPTVIGQAYVMRGQLISKTASSALIFPGITPTGGGGYNSAITTAASADLALVFTATTTTTYLAVSASPAATGNAIFDNVSLKPLTVAP